METATDLAVRLSRASVKKLWDPYTNIDWPEALDSSRWFMSPELISIYGTPDWEALSEEQRRRLSLFELANFFSLTLQGERPLVQGLVNQMYSKQNADVTDYIHHFLDEENKHMVMFADFCKRYAGKVYSYKKILLPKTYVKGEEDVTFFIKALIVEELGDVYNVEMGRDERLHPIVREVNNIHHSDEARHIVFGRRLLQETFAKWSPEWSQETLEGVRAWLGDYLRSSWADFYNPAMYRDAGLENAYEIRTRALEAEPCRAQRRRVSSKLVDFLLETGILLEEPAL